MSSQWKNKLTDAAPGTAKRRAFSTRPKLGQPVAGDDDSAPRRRRGLFEVADAAFFSTDTDAKDGEDQFPSRAEPNLVPENGALATDDLDDLTGTVSPGFDSAEDFDASRQFGDVYSDEDHESDTTNLPPEMLDQLKFDLHNTEAAFTDATAVDSPVSPDIDVPFVPKPRILGKRTADSMPGIRGSAGRNIESYNNEKSSEYSDAESQDGVDDFRQGLNEIEFDDNESASPEQRTSSADAASRKDRKNVHSIYEASGYDASSSASASDISRRNSSLTPSEIDPPVATTTPASEDNVEPVSPHKLSTPVNVPSGSESDTGSDATSGTHEHSPIKTNFARPASRQSTDEVQQVSPVKPADAQLSEQATPDLSPATETDNELAEQQATLKHGSDEQQAKRKNKTATQAEPSNEPPVETLSGKPQPDRLSRSSRSIREAFRVSLKRPSRSKSKEEITSVTSTQTPDDPNKIAPAHGNATVQDAVLGDSSAESIVEPSATDADSTRSNRSGSDTVQTLLDGNQQSVTEVDSESDKKGLPAGRYAKALRQKISQRISGGAEPAAPDQPLTPDAENASSLNEEFAQRHAVAHSQSQRKDAPAPFADTAAADSAFTDPTVADTGSAGAPIAGAPIADTPATDSTSVAAAFARTATPASDRAEPTTAKATETKAIEAKLASESIFQARTAKTEIRPEATADVEKAQNPQNTGRRLPLIEEQSNPAESNSTLASKGDQATQPITSNIDTPVDGEPAPNTEVLVQKHVQGNTVNKLLGTDEETGTYTVFLPKLDTPDPIERQPLVRDPVVLSLAVFSALFMLTAATGFVISRDIDVNQWLGDRVTDVKSHANDVASNIQGLTDQSSGEIAEQDHTSSIQPVSPAPQKPESADPLPVSDVQPTPQPINPGLEIDSENTLTGSLISSNGEPVAGEQIVLVSPSLGARFTTTTREDGDFALENLMPGDDYNLSISPAGPYKTLQVFDLVITESNTHMPLTLEAMPTANLSGRIVDADNNAVPNFQLWATGFDEPGQQVNFRSDHEGNYRLYGLPTGKVQFTSKSNPKILITSVVLNGGADEVVDLVVDYGTHQIGGIATDADGNPLGGVEVTLEWSVKRDSIRSMGTRTTSSDSDGAFRFTELGPGKHFLTARADGLPLIRRSIDVGIDNTEIALSLGATSSEAQVN